MLFRSSSYLDSSGIEKPSVKVLYKNRISDDFSGTVLYPNPTRSVVQWQSGRYPSDECHYEITDPMGKLIRKGSVRKQSSGNYLLNVEDLAVGNYLLHLEEEALLFSVIR